ncbi:uncharacterized protein LOC125315519 [Rhodamnia argentea]|uniref:Uncharacterized protein LOC125315519 n=1 Tax=Rhodamnia argentea TaxID=178133 RepID=A0ABM3HJ80_9MYRT|nr:uncharacterized protein LOC125315519 [Rhodamnia argentea]
MAAKPLRKHVHLDEGDVCSSCNLRSSCEKAYLLTNKEDEARTIDVMRVLATFGLDHAHGLVANKPLLKQKSVKIVVRKLLHQVVKLSAVPIDPNLPPPVIKRPPPKVKQPPPTPKRRVGRDDVEMKKGDWLCSKCDFMNFAKNTVCLQCDAKRPKRQLLPGEWECPERNFLNYRRNTACFHCDCKRPPDQFMEDKLQERHQNSRTRLERTATRPEVSTAWNFDFDDDESDGADVAAFEYADSSMKGKDSSLHCPEQGRNHQGFEEDFRRDNKFPRVVNREYSDSDHGSRTGFDDFDDEEDDVDSFEVDGRNNPPVRNGSSINFSEFEGDSGSEDGDVDNKSLARQKPRSPSPNRQLKPLHGGPSVPGSYDEHVDFDSEDESSVRPNWRSSHVADSRNRGRSRSPPGKVLTKHLAIGVRSEQRVNKPTSKGGVEKQLMLLLNSRARLVFYVHVRTRMWSILRNKTATATTMTCFFLAHSLPPPLFSALFKPSPPLSAGFPGAGWGPAIRSFCSRSDRERRAMADRLEGFCDPSSISYLTQREAAEIDENLMGPLGFSVDQLMELAGLSVATSIAEVRPSSPFSQFCSVTAV